MTKEEAVAFVEELLHNDPQIQEAVMELRQQGVSWEEIALRSIRAAKRIEREVP